jgi:hypothetical protein
VLSFWLPDIPNPIFEQHDSFVDLVQRTKLLWSIVSLWKGTGGAAHGEFLLRLQGLTLPKVLFDGLFRRIDRRQSHSLRCGSVSWEMGGPPPSGFRLSRIWKTVLRG